MESWEKAIKTGVTCESVVMPRIKENQAGNIVIAQYNTRLIYFTRGDLKQKIEIPQLDTIPTAPPLAAGLPTASQPCCLEDSHHFHFIGFIVYNVGERRDLHFQFPKF